MKYHIFVDEETRITFDDENDYTDGMCVTLADGVLLNDEEDAVEDERLDVEAMDATFAEFVGKYDLSDPEQRAYLNGVFADTKKKAEEKIADHTAMRDLSVKYLNRIAAHAMVPKRRRLKSM